MNEVVKETVKWVSLIGIFLLVGYALGQGIGVYEVTSGSMEPTIEKGDYIVTYDKMSYDSLENRTIIIFEHPETGELIVHRVVYHAEKGEDWTDDIDDSHFRGTSDCKNIQNCPAPYDGYITAGDGNFIADQVEQIPLIKPEHVRGVVWKSF